MILLLIIIALRLTCCGRDCHARDGAYGEDPAANLTRARDDYSGVGANKLKWRIQFIPDAMGDSCLIAYDGICAGRGVN